MHGAPNVAVCPRESTDRRAGPGAEPQGHERMVSETRSIIFTHAEVMRAIASYRRSRNDPLPAGELMGLEIGIDPDIVVTGRIRLEDDVDEHRFSIGGGELGAAIIMFCINESIPLPASNTSKRLQIFGESLGLTVHMNMPGGETRPFVNI